MLSSLFGKKKKKDPGTPNGYPYSPTANDAHLDPEEIKPKWVFYVQLAHGSPTGRIEGFSNVEELYEKISLALNTPREEILFCTLNTHRCDMSKLLGGLIGFDDFIFAHVKGRKKFVELTKSEHSIGLTVTDNGAGYSFIKRIWNGSTADKCETICVGDQVEAINNVSLVGCRHFEVASTLKGIPVGSTLSLTLNEPRKAFDMISQRKAPQVMANSNGVGSGKETLRLRSSGPATVEAVPTEQQDMAVDLIDDALESYMGIKDNELATTIFETGMRCSDPFHFKQLLQSTLAFQFPENFYFNVWGIISDAKRGRI